jgi:hypothetical protein
MKAIDNQTHNQARGIDMSQCCLFAKVRGIADSVKTSLD